MKVLMLLFVLILSCSAVAEVRDAESWFFHQSFGDLSEEVETAKEENKRGVMLFFEMDDCPFCARMKARILNQSQVQDFFRENFQIVAIDTQGDVEMTDFQGQEISQKDFAYKTHGVRATPTMMFFDVEGQLMARYTGATGTVEEFMWLGEFVVEGHYKTKRFSAYKREKRKLRD